jgi:hypothetical protein
MVRRFLERQPELFLGQIVPACPTEQTSESKARLDVAGMLPNDLLELL